MTSNPLWKNVYYLPAKELKLRELVKDGIVQVGDVWQFSFTVLDYEANASAVISSLDIGKTGTVDFNVTSTVSRPSRQSRAAYTSSLQYPTTEITSPAALQTSVLETHGFGSAYCKSTSLWELYTCYRSGQSIGTLKDLRQACFDGRTGGNPVILQKVADWEAVRNAKARVRRSKKKQQREQRKREEERGEQEEEVEEEE